MANLNEVKQSILGNYQHLKDRFNDILPEENQIFPMSIENLDIRMEDLKVEKASIFDSTIEDYKYNGLNNTVIVNKKYLERKDINLDVLYMDIVLQIAFYNPQFKYSGFGNETFEALNKGFREMLTWNLLQNPRCEDSFESDEYIYANLFGNIFDINVLGKAYFQNKPELITEELNKKSIESCEQYGKINELFNRNMKVRISKKGKSNLGELEFEMFKLLLMDNPSKEKAENFVAETIGSPSVFGSPEKYDTLSYYAKLIEEASKEYSNQTTEKTY